VYSSIAGVCFFNIPLCRICGCNDPFRLASDLMPVSSGFYLGSTYLKVFVLVNDNPLA
jgi:hypothetical protein